MKDAQALSPLELDALKELMNIGFGQAAVALSEVIDLRVVLSVPTIQVLNSQAVPDLLQGQIQAPATYTLVEEPFYGNFQGLSFFLLPSGEGAKLREILGLKGLMVDSELGAPSLEDEAILEIGNIVIGACVGKIAELLQDQVSFQPPRIAGSSQDFSALAATIPTSGGLAIVFRTVFHFEREDLAGHLFLVAAESCLEWIRKAVASYLESLG